MLQTLFTRAPLMALLGALAVFLVAALAGFLGLDWSLFLAVAFFVVAVGEAYGLWFLWQRKEMAERHLRQIRFIADRFQSMLRVLPGGYCLFTPQGLLREEVGVSERLGVEKITHLDELMAAVKDAGAFLEAFKRLQTNGQSFDLDVVPVKDGGASLKLSGRRFRVGREGPHVDLLWFGDVDSSRWASHLLEASIPVVEKEAGETLVAAVAAAAALSSPVQLEKAPGEKAQKQPEPALVGRTESPTPTVSALDALPVPVWVRDISGQLLSCNEAYVRAVELPLATILAEQAELAPAAKGKRGQPLAKGERLAERQHVVIAGQRRLLEFVEVPVVQEDRVVGSVGCAIDVTTEEECSADLKRHLAAHHEVLENLGTAITVYGPDMRLEFFNRAYQRLWDTPESFLDSRPTFGEVLEDLRARRKLPEQADFQKYKKERLALFTSLLEPREDVIYPPDGSSLRVVVAPHPMGGLIFVHENVTQQLALETSYNTLMAVQRETIDHLSEGIAVFGPDGKLRLFNPSFAKMWGLDEAFLRSEPHVSDLLEQARPLLDTGEDWDERRTKMVSYALDRNPRTGRMERTDQAVVEYLTILLPDGSVLNSFLDVTDSVRVEQALRASNAALATADQLKSDFVANVSYQLRTPLNTIIGFADILAEQYFGKLNERQMEYTTTIRAESEKLSRLINDVLDLATIEAGRMVLDRRPVLVADLLNEVKQMTAEWARRQSLAMLINCPSDIGSFEVDENRIKQVLFNLIGNAIKYTPAGGTIGLAAWKQDQWIVLSVLDTGVGIPESEKERVFGAFEKANHHLRQGGAGLGLSLVKSFVELHGGRVEIFSDAQDGTRVSCFLPQKTPALEGGA